MKIGPVGVTDVVGSGTIPGKHGGTATVRVEMHQFLWWMFGSLDVEDTAAGLPKTIGFALFSKLPTRKGDVTTVSGNWFTFHDGFKDYTVTARITDSP